MKRQTLAPLLPIPACLANRECSGQTCDGDALFDDTSPEKAFGLKTSAKFTYTCLLLCVAMILTGFTATGTIQAYQHFQQDHRRIQAGDATTVRSWMTIPYVSHVYRVPEPCFTQNLQLNNRWLVEHATLRVVADDYHRPLQRLLVDIQHVIVTYRRTQLACEPAPKTLKPPVIHVSPSSTLKGKAP
jgi:hypothetical protein